MSSVPGEKWWHGYTYTINSIIGAGILAIPWAYSNCGWALGILIQMLVLFISLSASYLMLSTWSRVESIAQLIESGVKVLPVSFTHLFSRTPTPQRLVEAQGEEALEDPLGNIQNKLPTIRNRKFDIYEIVKLTMGERWGNAVTLVMVFSCYPILLAYYSVFSKSLTSNVPIFGYTCNLYDEPEYFGRCRNVYWGYLAIFSTAMIVLSCFKLHEHKWMQLTLTCFRFIVIFIMLITSLHVLATHSRLEGSGASSPHPATVNLSGFSSIFFIIIFSSLFENTIPTTTGFVHDKPRHLPKIIKLSCFSFNIIYITFGLVLAFSIEDPEEMATLNWRNYTAGYDFRDRPWWTYVIAYTVILLPAMDIASSFPIIAGNFADNLMSIRYGHEKAHEISHVWDI